MADGPWRCSQCGTVNEPVANACRTCGRWPSLFELEESVVENNAPPDERPVPVFEGDAEPEAFELDDAEVESFDDVEPVMVDDEDVAPAKPVWQRFGRLIVPVAVAVYLVITAIVNR